MFKIKLVLPRHSNRRPIPRIYEIAIFTDIRILVYLKSFPLKRYAIRTLSDFPVNVSINVRTLSLK